MQKIISFLIFSFSIAVLATSCIIQDKEVQDKLNSKLSPNDQLLFQRTFPDDNFNFEAFREGLKQVKTDNEHRGFSNGFNQEWTVQGPANIGARINSIVVNPENENIIYAGFAHGGVFKTIDGGQNWNPIFDNQISLSIGTIALDPKDPDIVYVGTGDVNIPGGFFIGDGIYRSYDGGTNWENLGLKEQGIIAEIIVHPDSSNVIYAATMGTPSIRDNNRGVYKSKDNGSTWQQVLFVDEQAGVVDMVINRDNPSKIYCTSWDRYRTNYQSVVTGNNTAIWYSEDSGMNWTRLENDLPTGPSGRIGLCISDNNPSVLYASFAGEDNYFNSIYRTINGGADWTEMCDLSDFEELGAPSPLGGFAWYFGKIRVSPYDDNEIYLLGVDLWKSYDGGISWEEATPPWWQYTVHADKHDLVFTNENNILLGTDGGMYKSDSLTAEWEDIENIATTQFYRVAYNPHQPNRYYGGAQDNGTSSGNFLNIDEWVREWGGDGFQPIFNPNDSLNYYFETQNGNIRGTVDGGQNWFNGDNGLEGERRNWDMPYILSQHHNGVMYAGTYRLHRSDAGAEPEFLPVSEDLTDGTDNSRHNVSAISESQLDSSIVYCGTSDSRVWRINVETEVAQEITGSLPYRYVTSIKSSAEHKGWIYVTHNGYKFNEYIPHVHRSKDDGITWEDITSDLPDIGVNDIVILPNHADSIIFVGTDAGVYGSLDGGQSWNRLGSNMPYIPVFDMDINIANNELIAGTYARSIQTYDLDALFGTTSQKDIQALKKVEDIKVHPNPAKDHVQISFNNFEVGKTAECVIIDATGKIIYMEKLRQTGNINVSLDVSDWLPGTYYINVKRRHQVLSQQFIKY